jgi:hypothetical protein
MIKAYLPGYCLQGEDLPGHVIWDSEDDVEIRLEIPDSLKLKRIFNVPSESIFREDNNITRLTGFEVNGYLGLLFKSKILDEAKSRGTVIINITFKDDNKTTTIRKDVDLFRLSVEVVRIPETINVSLRPEPKLFQIEEKIRLQNSGDGTALISVDLVSKGDFELSPSSGMNTFQKAFFKDLRANLAALSKNWPHYASFINNFLDLAKPLTKTNKKTAKKFESVTKRLEDIILEDKDFLGEFISALGAAYMKNVQLVTELRSFLEYLDSIGEGRVILTNSVNVLRPKKREGILNLAISIMDLGFNEYDPIILPPIRVNCKQDCEIPIHLLFDWSEEAEKKLPQGGKRHRHRAGIGQRL